MVDRWTLLGLAFALALLAAEGSHTASEYLAGYLIERSLSLDNLFVFAVLFSFFAVPPAHRLRVLIFGVAAAIVLRGLFILAGAAAPGRLRGDDLRARRRAGAHGG